MNHIVLVNGWSASKNLWEDFAGLFPSDTRFQVIDLDQVFDTDKWMAEIDRRVEDGTVLMGWSLGGELAIHYAAQTQKKLKGLCLFQTNPCFVQKPDWHHAMSHDLFMQFSELVSSGDESAIRRQFAHMMVSGSLNARADRRALKEVYEAAHNISMPALEGGLSLLKDLDVRDKLNAIVCPVQSILGEADSLIPKASWDDSISKVVKGMGHVPCLSYKNEVYRLVQEFLA